jgi:Flp pilus assembly pilin Flp
MQTPNLLFSFIKAALRGSCQMMAGRNGFVATEYGLAMALISLGMLGGSAANRAVPLPVEKPVPNLEVGVSAETSVVNNLAEPHGTSMQAEEMFRWSAKPIRGSALEAEREVSSGSSRQKP